MIERGDGMSNPDDFGTPIGGTRWFNGEPTLSESPVQTIRQRWICPMSDCGGEMVFNGFTWPTGNPGYHHTCNKCAFTAAVHGVKYPRVTYKDVA